MRPPAAWPRRFCPALGAAGLGVHGLEGDGVHVHPAEVDVIEVKENSFTMPARDVTVSSAFSRKG